MSQRIKDGIKIDHTVYFIDDKKGKYPLTMRLVQALAVLLGGWGVVSIFVETFMIPVDVMRVNLALLLTAAAAYGLVLYPSFDAVKQFFAMLLYGLFFYSRLPRLMNGFYILENLILDRFQQYYGYHTFQYQADYTKAAGDTTLLVLMIFIPIIALLAAAVVRSRYIGLCSVILFLPVAACFAFGLIPSEKYLIAYILAMLFMARSGCLPQTVSREQKSLLQRINGRAAFCLSLMGLIVFLIIQIIVTPKEYKGVEEIPKLKDNIQTKMMNFSVQDVTNSLDDLRTPYQDSSNGGLSGGHLGKTGKVIYSGTEHLKVSIPLTSVQEGLYLKGYVGSDYTGDSWEGHSKAASDEYKKLAQKLPQNKFNPVNQISILLNRIAGISDTSVRKQEDSSGIVNGLYQYSKGRVEIEYGQANKKFLYTPYFTDYEEKDQLKYNQDLYAAPVKRKDSYKLYYYYNITLGEDHPDLFYSSLPYKLGDYTKYEKLYQDYVYEEYTKLPEKGLDRLKKEFSASSIDSTIDTVPKKINYVRKYLDSNTQYSLSPGKLPKGKDFVEYFLYENKIGYCAHYASAATLMLRDMNVPARYVEGYAVSTSDIQENQNEMQQTVTYSDQSDTSESVPEVTLSVKDYNAHAWVEVYIDNCGWVPVEFTPGSEAGYSTAVVNSMSGIDDSLKEKEKEDAAVTDAPKEPSVEPQVTEQPLQKKQSSKPTELSTEKAQKDQTSEIILLLAAASIFGNTVFAFIFRRFRRHRLKFTDDRNRKALYLFGEIEKIFSIGHYLPQKRCRLEDSEDYIKKQCTKIDQKEFSSCMEIVRKARFGKESISADEMNKLENFHVNVYNEIYKELPFIRKIYCKFILWL